jgi:zinc and cadmium transporter
MTTTKLTFIAIAIVLDGLAGLTGGLLPRGFVHRNISALLAFAAGTLMATALLDMLPDALAGAGHPQPPLTIMAAALAGFTAFHLVEALIGSHVGGQGHHPHGAVGPMIIIGDAIHNATDGVAIASAFLADVRLGAATALAVFVHELPHEIGDFAILLSRGYTRARAMAWLVVAQLAAAVGAAGTIFAARESAGATPLLLAFSAGGFIYISSANLIPELRGHEGRHRTKLLAFFGGIALIVLISLALSAGR